MVVAESTIDTHVSRKPLVDLGCGRGGGGVGHLMKALLGALIRETGWVTKRRMPLFTGQTFFIHWVMQFIFLTLICWTVIYPVDCIIHFLNKQEHLRIFCLVESGNNK